jgi:predicted GIY-YIG superfamily endonuclease
LEERFRRHNTNQEWKIVYYEAYLSERDARRREVKIKHYGQTRTRLKERISESLALK